MYTGLCTTPIAANTDDGGWQRACRRSTGLTRTTPPARASLWLFPNIALNVLPNHLFVMLAQPLAPRAARASRPTCSRTPSRPRTRASGDRRAGARSGTRSTARTSRSSSASSTGSTTTPYTGGRMCYRFEEPVHRFQNMVADRMVGRRGSRPATTPRRSRCSARAPDVSGRHRGRVPPLRRNADSDLGGARYRWAAGVYPTDSLCRPRRRVRLRSAGS